jgi:N-methylhydantoinase A
MTSTETSRRFSVAVDIGGTFTDCAAVDLDGRTFVGKVPTTEQDPSIGFFGAIEQAAAAANMSLDEMLQQTRRLAHATTVGLNAVVTRSGVRVGLLATHGHGDALWIMENSGRVTGASVEEMLDYAKSTIPVPLLSKSDVIEVRGRIDFAGDIIVPLHEGDVTAAAEQMADQEVDAIAIAFLWGHVNPEHEKRARELVEEVLARRGVERFVTCSHEVAPRIGEYARSASTVMNAYIGPLLRTYVARIVEQAREAGYTGEVLFGNAEGGLIDADTVKVRPISTLQSGPVGGTVACATLGTEMDFPNVLATDMGGTSLDVSIVRGGAFHLTDEAIFERQRLNFRKVAVESIGAGGGSIAWLDEAGGLRVGPQSAGSHPGPACYGRGGTEPTVSDADLLLGILNPERVLAGGVSLDVDAAERAIKTVADPLGMTPIECAAGIVEIADNKMESLVRRVALQGGNDPRDFVLWAFGGAAGMHAGLYGRGLGIEKVVIPMNDLASVWSAYGMAMAGETRTFEVPLFDSYPFDPTAVEEAFAQITAEARAYADKIIGPDSLLSREVTFVRSADLKYSLQEFEVEAAFPDGPFDDAAAEQLVSNFERTYEQRYGEGSGYRDAGVALTALRLRVEISWDRPPIFRPAEHNGHRVVERSSERPVFWRESGGMVSTPAYDGAGLLVGDAMDGPAIIEYPDTTVAVRPGQRLTVDDFGNLVITLDR